METIVVIPSSLQSIRLRRSAVLLLTLIFLVLLIIATARLGTACGVDAVQAARETNSLQHELAVDSMLLVAADALETFEGELMLDLELGECQVSCRIVSDAAKFNVRMFEEPAQKKLLSRKLRQLQRTCQLPDATIQLRPVLETAEEASAEDRASYLWYDQLLTNVPAGGILSSGPGQQWADVVTLFGDGQVDIALASDEVLKVVLNDLGADLARSIRTSRGSDESLALRTLLDKVSVPDRERIMERIGLDIPRYAFWIETSIHHDCRHWYIVADVHNQQIAKIYYRGQVEW